MWTKNCTEGHEQHEDSWAAAAGGNTPDLWTHPVVHEARAVRAETRYTSIGDESATDSMGITKTVAGPETEERDRCSEGIRWTSGNYSHSFNNCTIAPN